MSAELDSQLLSFVEVAKRNGAADSFIVELLKASGWSERRIYTAFAAYYGKVTGLAVPVRGSRFEYASDGFLYLLAFSSLACWATGVGHLIYVLVDDYFPSALDSPYITSTLRDRVSLELATIIVAFPLFLIVSALINRQLIHRPESADSGVRKWLTYIALVIAALLLLGDAIFFLQAYLHGDLSIRFVLDTLVLFGIVGPIFGYYLSTLRRAPVSKLRDRSYAAASVALTVLALTWGFAGFGSPQRQASVSLDERRVADLVRIEQRIASAYAVNHQVPNLLPGGPSVFDPQTGLPYEYKRIDARRYRLCTDFATIGTSPMYPEFAHRDERTCFTLVADAP